MKHMNGLLRGLLHLDAESAKNTTHRLLASLMALAMAFSILPGRISAKAEEVVEEEGIVRYYPGYTFEKISNPTAGPKEPDGINTNDTTGYPANRLNSYAWAVVSRGNAIYIGTNRTLFGSALNAVVENLQKQNPDISAEQVGNIVSAISGGDVPVNLEEEDYIPQIIKFDLETGSTEVIFQPQTAVGEDGKLYYTDKYGTILPEADVPSETSSFRSVISYKDNLYFGSLGSNILQLVRIDENDNATVVFQTIGLASSLRAGATYDPGDGETVFFGGQDTTYLPWRIYRRDHPGEAYPLPIVIRYLDPETAGTESENWDGLVADFDDFGKYAFASVYASGGGNVWDLCSYNGKLYLVMAYDGGWVLFRGEKGGDAPNQFGWTWTEIVGDDGKYPCAMNEEVTVLNEQYRQDYACSEYASNLTGVGLLESTATPYVFNGKMYLGSFDNATVIQSQTVIKVIAKIRAMQRFQETGDLGPTLAQIYAPIYEVLSHPQHIYAMDENENIVPVDSANELLEGTTNDYVWRFIEHKGKLYTGTFDSSTAYKYFLDISMKDLLSVLREQNALPEYVEEIMDAEFSKKLEQLSGRTTLLSSTNGTKNVNTAAIETAKCLEAFLQDNATVEELLESRLSLDKAVESSPVSYSFNSVNSTEDDESDDMISFLLSILDIEGLKYWAQARALASNAEKGFDIFVTEDGENFERIVGNGLEDSYNYGARTFTVCNNELYVGTANPYYGAQLWKISPEMKDAEIAKAPEVIENLEYNGSEQELITAGTSEGGTMVYAISYDNVEFPDLEAFSETIPVATSAGTYYVWYYVIGDEDHNDSECDCLEAVIGKAIPAYEIPELSATYGQTLADVTLPEGWAWVDDTASVGEVGVNTFLATYTPEDTDNYLVVENIETEVKVTANKESLSAAASEAEEFCNSIQDKPEIADKLAKALEEAKAVLENELATQKEVDDAEAALRAALADAKEESTYTGFRLSNGTPFAFVDINGVFYWYEDDVRQGTKDDLKGVKDTQFGEIVRGREIFDPNTNAWYWLDADADGAVARNKEVWMPYVFQDEEPGSTDGKWVRYDKYGQMIKGWYANDTGVYYYDKETGAMYKGTHVINGKTYTFDETTGIMQ